MNARIPFKLTKEQQKAMDMEIQRQCVEINAQYEKDYDTIIMWTLNEIFGFGDMRISKFYESMISERNRLNELYSSDINPSDDIHLFAMRTKLKERGIDIDKIINNISTKK